MADAKNEPVNCEFCKMPLKLNAVIVDGRLFHRMCFHCFQCKTGFGNGAKFNEIEGKIYCMNCYCKQIGIVCNGCQKSTYDQYVVQIFDHNYHIYCAKCISCEKRLPIEESRFVYSFENQPICLSCAKEQIDKSARSVSPPHT